ncbi:MAG: tetratricopeptide repeat protein [Chitinophagaceae bacterium]
MKAFVFFLCCCTAAVAMVAFTYRQSNKVNNQSASVYKNKTIIRCGTDWEVLKDWLEETDIPPMPGAGIYKWRISTKSDSAQFYFNQGINMYYGLHIIEAMASFKKAAKFDAECATIHWAQALVYGPNINDYGFRASPEALKALNKAKQFASTATAFEKELIDVMSVRYTADSADATRKQLNEAYTAKMKLVAAKFPGNAEALALYADAMMLEHPWDLWNVNGTPKAWTPAIRKVLEQLLTLSPMHPGGNHYYIHVMEASPFAKLALPSAERLGATNPGLSHMVHMPSHIYLRTGLYKKGVDVNVNAVNSYQKSIPLYAPVTGADFLYIIHNLHMKANNAMMMGNEKITVSAAIETQKSIPDYYLPTPAPLGNLVQYIYHTPVLINVRFAKWNELLEMKQPPSAQVFSNILFHFGRGMALANTAKMDEAKKQLQLIQLLMKDSSLSIPYSPFSPAIDAAVVAEQLLSGTIALKEKRINDAVTAFQKASAREESMVYNEPRDWLLNPKHYYGNTLLVAGKAKEAQTVFEKDLKNNAENGWALMGLYNALQMQKKTAEATAVLARYKKVRMQADVDMGLVGY